VPGSTEGDQGLVMKPTKLEVQRLIMENPKHIIVNVLGSVKSTVCPLRLTKTEAIILCHELQSEIVRIETDGLF
jgi:hypothetical protein